VLAAQVVSASFVVSQAKMLRGRDPVTVSALQLLAAAALTLPLALSEGTPSCHASMASVVATGLLVVAGTVGPTVMFAYGQTRVRADVAGAFVNLEPLVGAIAGTVLFADPLGAAQLAGGAAILAGIGLSSMQAVRGRCHQERRPCQHRQASADITSTPGTTRTADGDQQRSPAARGKLAVIS